MKIDVPEYALSGRELWRPQRVREALVDAFRLLRATGGRVGPKGMQGYWPQFASDYAPKSTKTSPYSTRMTVTRMEMVLCGWKDEDGVSHDAWLQGELLAEPDLKNALEAWIFAELRGEPIQDLCDRKKLSRATFYRWRDKASSMIAVRLNVEKIEAW